MLLASLLTATDEEQDGDLFSAVDLAAARARTRASVSTASTTLRRRVVTIDFGMLTRTHDDPASRDAPAPDIEPV